MPNSRGAYWEERGNFYAVLGSDLEYDIARVRLFSPGNTCLVRDKRPLDHVVAGLANLG
jgi:hypothetical protein